MKTASLVMRRATPHDAAALTELTRASKAYWPYDKDFMLRVDPDLVVHEAELANGALRGEVALAGDEIVGYFAFRGERDSLWLDSMFVTPAWIGRGAGRALWDSALAFARALGADSFAFESDPHAEAFYVKMGATRTGERPSRFASQRMLPLFRVDLSS